MSQDTRKLGQTVDSITKRIPVLVREEVALAKAEVTQKVGKLGKGAAIGAVAAVFVIGALLMLLWGFASLITWLIGGAPFWGYFIMAVLLLIIAAIAGLVAKKAIEAGSPPAPQMAIDEAKLIRETVQSENPKAHQVETAKAVQKHG